MDVLRFGWEFYANKALGTLHVNCRLFERGSAVYDKGLSERDKNLVDFLESIPGVSSVSCLPYLIHVNIGLVFDWDDIKDRVVDVLKKWCGATRVEEVSIAVRNHS